MAANERDRMKGVGWNRCRAVAEYFLGKEVRSYPQEIVIELTNHCNLACVMCPQKTMQRPKGFMEEGLFRKIVDEISGKTELVYLYGTGESLLHPRVDEYTRYAASRGLTTCLSTNGMKMDEAASRKLLTSGLDFLIVALDGGTKETYERIRVKGNFDKLVSNVKTLLQLKRELKSTTHLCLQLICMPQNWHEIDAFLTLFSQEEKQAVDQFRYKPFYETYATKENPVIHTRPCYWLWNMMSIYWNGDVPLCCIDADAAYCFGNAGEQSVREIWQSSPFEALRKRHRGLNYDSMPLCDTCDIPEQGYFNGATILGSACLSAGRVRKLLPLYEKYVVLPRRQKKAVL